LESVKNIASEIIVVDEYSTDKTVEITKKFGAKVFLEPHHDIFHITKQKALDMAIGEWILQLDADEAVTPELAKEIKLVIRNQKLEIPPKKMRLFMRHQRLIEIRDGVIGNGQGGVVGFFIPRLNMFLGKPLIHAGVYPDGVIRLIKNGKARFPQKSVHEQIQLDGEVSWLSCNLLHYDSPTLKRYLSRLNRYTDLHAEELRAQKLPQNFGSFFRYTIYKPLYTFVNLYFRHLGLLDGAGGFLWSFFSAMHFPVAYFKYITFKGQTL
jgi:glycosyltransferase involved in cell wall biosynthesis